MTVDEERDKCFVLWRMFLNNQITQEQLQHDLQEMRKTSEGNEGVELVKSLFNAKDVGWSKSWVDEKEVDE